MRRLSFIFVSLVICAGCHRELSVVEGVSVRSAKYQGWGQSPDADGLRLYGHTLSDLGGRSVSSEAVMPKDRIISFLGSSERYDVTITGGWQGRGELCREMLERTFGVCATRTSREIDVLVLVPVSGKPVVLEATKSRQEPDVKTWPLETCRHGLAALLPRPRQRVTHTFTSCDMTTLAAWLDGRQEKVVLDETGLSGMYDFQLIDDPRSGDSIQTSLAAIGLELQPAQRTVPGIYVETTGQAAPISVARTVHYAKSFRPWWSGKRQPGQPQ